MNFIFLGPPGAGKGTLAAAVSKEYGIPHISTGDIFRLAIKNQTELGKKVKAIIDSGALVSDEITTALVEERLSQADAKNGFILDGFPRTIPQAQALAEIGKKSPAIKIDSVVNFDASDKTVIERLSGRRVCKSCGQNYHAVFLKPKTDGICDSCGGVLFTRDDDKPEAITHRLEVYREQTEPLIEFYRKFSLITDVDSNKEVDAVASEFRTLFKK